MNDRINHDQDYDKVIEMLTPRFPRKGYGRRRRRWRKHGRSEVLQQCLFW